MKIFGCIVALLYISYIGLGIAHAQMPSHSCKAKGAVMHSCSHRGMGSRPTNHMHHPDGSDRTGPPEDLPNARVDVLKVALNAATFGLAFQGEASVPTSCTCYVSCFFGGQGLPTPDYGPAQ